MQQLILILHVMACVCVISLVLLQHGKGADMGASFGSGSSNTMFGSVGPAPFLMKLTGFLAGVFFLTSLGLSFIASHQKKQVDNLSLLGNRGSAAGEMVPGQVPTKESK
jgi:preprotein translocase subunit SecG